MVSNCRKIFNLFTLSFVLISTTLFAQNYNDVLRLSQLGLGSNARALGMGNAYTGLSDDFSASSFNPAGFGLLKRMEFAGGLYYSKFNNSTDFLGNNTDYSNSNTKLNQISFAFPFPTMRGSLVFAVGYNRDVDFNKALKFNGFNNGPTSMIQDLTIDTLSMTYDPLLLAKLGPNGKVVTDINGNLNQSGTILSSGSVGRWAFSGAVELTKNVFVGATVNVISGDYKWSSDYYEEDTKGVYRNIMTDSTISNNKTLGFNLFYLGKNINWDISGWDANVGVLYQLKKSDKLGLRFGANIKFPTSYTIKEKYTDQARSEFRNATFYLDPADFESEYDISTPYVFSGGISVNYMGLIVSGSLSFIDYTQMEFSSGLPESDISLQNRIIKEDFTSTINYNLGAEYTIPEIDLRLRGGFILNPSPFKSDENTSVYDKKYLTGGIGFLADESFSFDIAYAYGWWKDFGDNYGVNVSRTNQSITTNNLIFTFSYRF